MSSEKLYSEIFEDFNKATTKEERVAILRKNYHIRFAEFLQMALHPEIVFDVAIPKYRLGFANAKCQCICFFRCFI